MGVDGVATAVQTLHEVLDMDPNHQQALEFLEKAEERAGKLAEYFLTNARLHKSTNVKKCREELETVIRLDPDGPFGMQAKKLLETLDGI